MSTVVTPSAVAPLAAPRSAANASTPTAHRCRLCDAPLSHVFVDLGVSPLCESYLSASQLDDMEPFYPLTVYICRSCLLVQMPTYVGGEEIFGEYAYFSSYSASYLDHARQYAKLLIDRFALNSGSYVVELASNDGYLLQNFVAQGIPCLGIEPAANIAAVAQQKGIPTLVRFFGERVARELVEQGKQPDVIVANNVFAHVPDLRDFTRGLQQLLAPNGVVVIEVQHLMRLIERNQFDTIYHEHFCYYTLLSLQRVLADHGLVLFDVEEVPTHGGSLRIFVRHMQQSTPAITPRVDEILQRERAAGLHDVEGYHGFAAKVARVKGDLLEFLIRAKREGCRVAGYGAPGKGNTLLNYCGIRQDLLEYTVDRNPYKQGKFLPGSRIPIFAPERIAETRPEYVLILPWNFREEIAQQLSYISDWGGQLVVPIPQLEILPPDPRA